MPSTTDHISTAARLLVVLMAFAWGFNWIAGAIALREVPVFSLRTAGSTLGAVTLFAAALIGRRSLYVPPGERIHVAITGFFNVTVFNITSALAQTHGATSRAIIVAYSMPIWVTLMSRFMLGDRLNKVRAIALTLCVLGLGILVWPQFELGVPVSIYYALLGALSWAFATVYLKWAKVTVDPLANAAWQLAFGALCIIAMMLVVDGYPHLWPITWPAMTAILYIGIIGVGLAHFLWWSIVGRLPALIASIGALLVPVVGVIASTIFLGERPSVPDIIGFALIFAAAASVLLQPAKKAEEPATP